ncbi:LysR family transcriptional regulator [Pseudomonas aeruginosa]
MEWGDVKIFLAIVRAGTFSGAAAYLKVSRPTVSRRLQALEDALGQKLFQRTGDGLLITAEGESVIELAEKMEESALALDRKMAAEDARLEGELKITCAEWFAGYVLPEVLVNFSRKYPRIRIEILSSANLLDLSRRDADIAFRNIPFDKPDIVQRKLMDINYAVYAADSYMIEAASAGEGVELILMNSDLSYFPDVTWILKVLPKATVAHRSNARSVQAKLCSAGLGLAVLPVVVGQKVPGLKVIDLGESPPGRELWLGYHRDLRDLKRLRELVNAVVDSQSSALRKQ